MDFPLADPGRYRASGNAEWEDDPGMSFLRDIRITAMFH